MKSFSELLNLVNQSDMTLIGYTFKDEKIKDDLISNFNYIEIEKIDSSFSFKSFLRDLKLNSLFTIQSVKNPEYILFDINNIFYDTEDIGDRQRQISNTLMKIREDIYYSISGVYPQNPSYKIIVTCPLYKSGVNIEGGDINNFIGGSKPLYMSDLAMFVYSDIIKVTKNRLGEDGDYILYNTKQVVEI